MTQQLDDRIAKAIRYAKSDHGEAAREVLTEVLRQDPNNERAWLWLSQVAHSNRERVVFLRQVIRVNPQNELARRGLEKLGAPVAAKAIPEDGSNGPTQLLASKAQAVAAVAQVDETPAVALSKKKPPSTVIRVAKYAAGRALLIFLTVVVGVYLTILVANLGGYVDEILRGMIDQQIMGMIMGGWLDDVPTEEQHAIIEQTQQAMQASYGLDRPFLLRSLSGLVHGLTLNLGDTELWSFFRGLLGSGNQRVQSLVLQSLPFTLVLVGFSNLLLFIATIFVALFLSRRYGGVMDRIVVTLASLNSAPSWIYGILLIFILAGTLRILPFPKTIDMRFAEWSPEFVRLMLQQMILPVLAIVFSVFFQGIYTWRTFFLLYSQEDYVEMAVAQGLSPRDIERRYILRPALPFVLTNFAMVMISLWEGSIALELLFFWPGVGRLFVQAVQSFNTQLIVAVVVVFAYILAITVFLLDFIYSLVDPRIGIKSEGAQARAARKRNWNPLHLSFKRRTASYWEPIEQGQIEAVPELARPKISLSQRLKRFWRRALMPESSLRQLTRYPSAIVGLLIIISLIGIAIYAVTAIPYDEAVVLWQTHSTAEGKSTRYRNPKNAMPVWVNLFRRDKLPKTMVMSTTDGSAEKVSQEIGEEMTEISTVFTYDYAYEYFPEEISVFFTNQFEEKRPHLTLTWLTPDGREINLGNLPASGSSVNYNISQDEHLQRKFGDTPVIQALFTQPDIASSVPLKGEYQLTASAIVFEEGADVEVETVLYGRVFGLAGTDDQRRDLMIALLWGTPVALAFGLVGAIVTSVAAMIIAAIGAWYGGWVDNLIQRITEINIMVPSLLIAIMVYIMYSKSIWAILGVIVLLNVFGSSIKNYRATFLQVKESSFIEAAQAYGASNPRIILRYLIPRVFPILIPQLVIMVPGYVFYEATLAYLEVSDPYLPTWGKVIYDAITSGVYQEHYYWVLEPIALLLITGLAFALFGFALDRVFNPRLREA